MFQQILQTVERVLEAKQSIVQEAGLWQQGKGISLEPTVDVEWLFMVTWMIMTTTTARKEFWPILKRVQEYKEAQNRDRTVRQGFGLYHTRYTTACNA